MSPPELMSCKTCRDRKLKCDRTKPKCGRCVGTKRECSYPERKRSVATWRRCDVKSLEARLRAAESKLALSPVGKATSINTCARDSQRQHGDEIKTLKSSHRNQLIDDCGNDRFAETASTSMGLEHVPAENRPFWPQDLDELGLQESLPPEEIQEDLFKIYFDQVHSHIPMIHRSKFFATRKNCHNLRPFLALQYAMWAIAASASPKYRGIYEVFIQRARKCAKHIETEGTGESNVTLYDAQSWCLIANAEAQRMHITRAWTSTGKCVRVAQMIGLHCVDGPSVYATSLLSSTTDFVELEERRRTFWAVYLCDRWTSALGGWPMTIQENGIFTNLPTSEISYNGSLKEASVSLAEAMAEGGASKILSSFSGVILATTLLAREYEHIQQSSTFQNVKDCNDTSFWDRHRKIDNALSTTFLYLPEHLKTAHELHDPNAIFLGMALQAATICLHRTAISKSLNCQVYSDTVSQSLARCTTAAHAIATTIRLVGQDSSKLNPWTGFCLYLAGLVYCHDLEYNYLPDHVEISNITLLLETMKLIGLFHPITEYLAARLELEMDAVERRRTSNREIAHLSFLNEYRYSNDLNSEVQHLESQTQIWRSLSQKERTTLSRKFHTSVPMTGILLFGGHGCSVRNSP